MQLIDLELHIGFLVRADRSGHQAELPPSRRRERVQAARR
jgi:hypothetical protein